MSCDRCDIIWRWSGGPQTPTALDENAFFGTRDGLQSKLAITSLTMVAIAFAVTAAREASAATMTPPDGSALTAQTLVRNVCSECHGATGVGICPLFPNLAGQLPVYIDSGLKLFGGVGGAIPGREPSCVPRRLVSPMSRKSKGSRGNSQPSAGLARHRAIRRCLNRAGCSTRTVRRIVTFLPAWSPTAATARASNTNPRLAGQPRGYVAAALLQFRGRLRENKLMQHVTQKLADDEIAALVEYISTK